jgi:hypothetical protein
MVQPGRPYVTIWRMHIQSWVPKATHTHSQYVILNYYPTGSVVARTRLYLTLYLHFRPCFFTLPYNLRKVGFFDVRQIFRLSTAVTVKITVLDM